MISLALLTYLGFTSILKLYNVHVNIHFEGMNTTNDAREYENMAFCGFFHVYDKFF
jgi:hypothetical protein